MEYLLIFIFLIQIIPINLKAQIVQKAELAILANEGKDTIIWHIYGDSSAHQGMCIYGTFRVWQILIHPI